MKSVLTLQYIVWKVRELVWNLYAIDFALIIIKGEFWCFCVGWMNERYYACIL